MTTIYLEANKVPATLRGAYRGNKFQVKVCESMTVPMTAGLWDGGSRDLYSGVRLADGAGVELPGQASAPWDASRADRRVELRPGFAVVCHSHFCGTDMGLRFYLHPSDAVALLPAPVELTALEGIILEYTAGRKASYMGKNRYQMARDDFRHGYSRLKDMGELGDTFPPESEWENTKAKLIVRGFLTKAGAITPAGRNARPSKY